MNLKFKQIVFTDLHFLEKLRKIITDLSTAENFTQSAKHLELPVD